MHAHGRLSLARFLAPIALIAFTVAVFAIVTGSGVLGEDSSSESTGPNDLPAATDKTATTTTPKQKKSRRPTRSRRTTRSAGSRRSSG